MKNSPIVGIDLGTTYSAIAYVNQHGKAEIIRNREGESITPSAVLFDGDTPIVGTLAKRSAVASPHNVCQAVKRQMGERDWRFTAESGTVYTAEEISALILRRLKEDAETVLNCNITEAVITVPAYFDDAQRKSTQDAGQIAGLNVRRIINEPTAAALAYSLEQKQGQTIMVYDLGGGTFDVTIMKIAAGSIEAIAADEKRTIDVIATDGARDLGGLNWDEAIMDFLTTEFKKSGGIDLTGDPALKQDLRDKAEIAKKTLSSRDNAKVFLSAGGKSASIDFSRTELERCTAYLLDRTQTIMEMALDESGLGWRDIDKILLVGGSTRMKAVSEMIEKVSGQKPSVELHPDEVVAAGAALLGGILEKGAGGGSGGQISNVVISDVNSHSLGVVAHDSESGEPFNSIILPKDTPVLTRASEVYTTVCDYQEEINIQVTEGEGTELDYVRILDATPMRIPRHPKGAPFEMSLEYDSDGLIRGTLFDLTLRRKVGDLEIKRESNRSSSELATMKRKMDTMEVQ